MEKLTDQNLQVDNICVLSWVITTEDFYCLVTTKMTKYTLFYRLIALLAIGFIGNQIFPVSAQDLRVDLQQALEVKNWNRAIEIVDKLIQANPQDVQELREYKIQLQNRVKKSAATTQPTDTAKLTNSTPSPNLIEENILSLAKTTPITLLGKGLLFVSNPFSPQTFEFNKIFIYVDNDQVYITTVTFQDSLNQLKVSFIGKLADSNRASFLVNVENVKFEQQVYSSEVNQFRSVSESKASVQFGNCTYFYQFNENQLSSIVGNLSCNISVNGNNILGLSEVKGLPIIFEFKVVGREQVSQ